VSSPIESVAQENRETQRHGGDGGDDAINLGVKSRLLLLHRRLPKQESVALQNFEIQLTNGDGGDDATKIALKSR